MALTARENLCYYNLQEPNAYTGCNNDKVGKRWSKSEKKRRDFNDVTKRKWRRNNFEMMWHYKRQRNWISFVYTLRTRERLQNKIKREESVLDALFFHLFFFFFLLFNDEHFHSLRFSITFLWVSFSCVHKTQIHTQ